MREITRLLSIRQLRTTPYHAQCNGLVERFNGTIRRMLQKMAAERLTDWDRYLPALLFAYREVTQESVGFSPFELVLGRSARGPMRVIRDLWANEETGEEVRTTYQYILELRERDWRAHVSWHMRSCRKHSAKRENTSTEKQKQNT